jgi:ribonuclease BN (tRNA processing enzyme)
LSASHILFLGTGTAFHQDGRGSQAILVHPESGSPFLVDLGPTGMSAMMRMGVHYDALDRLFFTHLHGDHVAGWPFLLLNLNFLAGRRRPLDVWGPTGVRECLEGLTGWCYREILQQGKLGFAVRYHELAVAEATGLDAGDGLTFDTMPMEHHPSSIGYRFVCGGKSVAVTGDTRWCAALERLARASDLLLVECTSPADRTHHVALQDIRQRIGDLGSCAVVLVHLTDEVAAELAADPVPRVSAAYDGMRYPW